MPDDDMLAAAYALDGPESNRALYARWAESYESDFIAKTGYVYHQHVAEVFAGRGSPAEPVLDVGCGTGLAGQSLRQLGVTVIDGIDISAEMLERARQKRDGGVPVYRSLIEADLTQPLEFADGSYGGAISVGTFTHGHVGPAALQEVVRVLRPGGRAAIGVNAAHFAAEGFATMFEQLVATGRIANMEVVDVAIYAGADMSNPDEFAHVVLFDIPHRQTSHQISTPR